MKSLDLLGPWMRKVGWGLVQRIYVLEREWERRKVVWCLVAKTKDEVCEIELTTY